MSDRRVICVDVETSGLGRNAAILEVAAVDMESGKELYFVPHVDSLEGADPEALAINRYYERRLYKLRLTEPETKLKYHELAEMLRGNTFAGCNPAFDAGLLQFQHQPGFNVVGQVWHHRLADLSAYAAGTLGLPPGDLPGLARVCELLFIKNDEEHSALGDARATAQCFRSLMAIHMGRSMFGPDRKPRQWDSLDEVPHDVRVKSAGGCQWRYWQPGETDGTGLIVTTRGEWLWRGGGSGDTYDKNGPFTEVIDIPATGGITGWPL